MSADTPTTHFVLIHGAWHGGWCWSRVTERLNAAGFAATAPTLTGLAERRDALSRGINLSTHINDIIAAIQQQGGHNVTLVGHSYGGFPTTAAAYHLPDIVSHLILLDAFLPAPGEKLLDHAPDLITAYQTLKKTYIRCTRAAGNYLTTSIQRAQTDPTWRFLTLDSDHDAMIDAPDALTTLLTSSLTTRTPL
ncbi:alpha/beta fold hydrolase [Pectobacterium aroidearum]|uniref:alpha/beta fold hydrolase n=1 Tax=Pectobacterium aroidearum TaxID=1201031 RepID=UPI0032F00709